MIGLLPGPHTHLPTGERLAAAWPGAVRVYRDIPEPEAACRAFTECAALVCFQQDPAAAVRLLLPLLDGCPSPDDGRLAAAREATGTADGAAVPDVVWVAAAGEYVVPLLDGVPGGAGELATEVADTLPGCEPVGAPRVAAAPGHPVDGASGVGLSGLGGLAALGWPVEGELGAVTRQLRAGRRVTLRADGQWPLPALPPQLAPPTAEAEPLAGADSGAASDGWPGPPTLWVTDRVLEPGPQEAVLRPPSLAVGVGASSGVSSTEVLDLVRRTLWDAGLSVCSLTALATVDAKAGEAGLIGAAEELGVPLRTFPAAALSTVGTSLPASAAQAAVGTGSVCEAAALLAADTDRLLVPKVKSAPVDGAPARATAAVARHRRRGRLAVVGLGPGPRDLLTPRARRELRRAAVLVGLDEHVDRVRELLRPGTRVLASGRDAAPERARTAVEEARAGRAVALVGNGDAGTHPMAWPALDGATADMDVLGVPGVPAARGAPAGPARPARPAPVSEPQEETR